MLLKAKALLSGLATHLPGYRSMLATGGTDSARYCYSVWLRHLMLSQAAQPRLNVPQTVAELGPGDSIGIGLAALLSGVEKYYALDVVQYRDFSSNLAIFDELVELFRRREPPPGDEELPHVRPKLAQYAFPHDLLPDAWLDAALAPERIAEIRAGLQKPEANSRILYQAPWTDPSLIQPGSVDMIYSQAVLEHVTDMSGVYQAMRIWLKPSGVMTHQIDYRCHGKADTWNGHWTYSDTTWKVIVGRRPYLLNRAPHSEHMKLLRLAGFEIVSEKPEQATSEVRRADLAKRFSKLTDADLTTCGAFVVAAAASQAPRHA